MASNANDLKTAVAKRPGGDAPARAGGYASIEGLLAKYEQEIKEALPAHIVGQQFMRLILQEFRLNPKLIQCEPASILGAVMTCARLGLEPGPLGFVYLIPYQRRIKQGTAWTQVLEAQVQVGYKGFVQLAYRSGQVANITPYTINANDRFEWHGGHQNEMVHEISDFQNRGAVQGYYLVIQMKDGSKAVSRPWSVGEIETHRKKFAQTQNGAKTPAWEKSFDTMAAKTVFKDMVRWFPISTELVALTTADERTVRSEKGESDLGELLSSIDYSDSEVIEGEVVDTSTGEVLGASVATDKGPDWEAGMPTPEQIATMSDEEIFGNDTPA